jgi:UDP-N-acetylmuramyl pentapeptide phosphotransferase/UDP-N-acetylglucosamine-1-phosphate transferase
MFIWIYDAILLISAFVFAAIGTGAAYFAMRRLGVVDVPNERSNHATPTPRGGGLGIVFASVCFLMVTDAPGELVWGMILLAALSLWDDFKPLPPQKRLLGQVIIVAWLLTTAFEGHVFNGLIPNWLELPVLVLIWLWFINLFNFMDGSDGLAASEAICICIGLLTVGAVVLLPLHAVSYALITIGAVLGFVIWNWQPAKVFMGDVGSIPLGFLLGFMLLSLAGGGYPAAAVILPAVFIADASVTLLRRLIRRERIFDAHSSHAYQRAIRGGMSHAQVARNVIGTNIVLIVLAVFSTMEPAPLYAFGTIAAAYALAFVLLTYFATYRGKPVDAPKISDAEVIEEIPAPDEALLADYTAEHRTS